MPILEKYLIPDLCDIVYLYDPSILVKEMEHDTSIMYEKIKELKRKRSAIENTQKEKLNVIRRRTKAELFNPDLLHDLIKCHHETEQISFFYKTPDEIKLHKLVKNKNPSLSDYMEYFETRDYYEMMNDFMKSRGKEMYVMWIEHDDSLEPMIIFFFEAMYTKDAINSYEVILDNDGAYRSFGGLITSDDRFYLKRNVSKEKFITYSDILKKCMHECKRSFFGYKFKLDKDGFPVLSFSYRMPHNGN